MGADMRGGNPSPGNIAGGLSTIEEKSLGCISKCGTGLIQDVIAYAEQIQEHGLYFMDSPGNDIECVQVWPHVACTLSVSQQDVEHQRGSCGSC